MESLTIFQRIAVYALPLLFALTVREMVRGRVAHALGDNTGAMFGRLSLNPLNHVDPIGTLLLPGMMLVLSSVGGFGGFLIGWPKLIPINERNFRNPRRDIALVAVSGLAANLVMAFLWGIVLKIAGGHVADEGLWLGVKLTAFAGISINASFFVLNLLPLPPFDLGRVLVSVLPPRQSIALASIERYSFVILMVLVITGIIRVIFVPLMTIVIYLVFGVLQINI